MMKLLLDESLPLRLAGYFPESYEVSSVHALGWLGAKNGVLLSMAVEAGFEVLLTADRHIEYQQNLEKLPCAIIVLHVHPSALPNLVPFVPQVVELCNSSLEKSVYHVPAS